MHCSWTVIQCSLVIPQSIFRSSYYTSGSHVLCSANSSTDTRLRLLSSFMCHLIENRGLSQYKDVVLPAIGIPMLKIRRSRNRLIFNMGISTPGKTVFILRWGSGLFGLLLGSLYTQAKQVLFSERYQKKSFSYDVIEFKKFQTYDEATKFGGDQRGKMLLILHQRKRDPSLDCVWVNSSRPRWQIYAPVSRVII